MKNIFFILFLVCLGSGSMVWANNTDTSSNCNPKDLVKVIDLNGQLLSTSLELQSILTKQLEDPMKQNLKVSGFRKNLKTPEKLKLQKQWSEGLDQFTSFLKQHPECESFIKKSLVDYYLNTYGPNSKEY